MQRFTVAIPKGDGGVEVYPMKEWLRQHPESIPPGLSPGSNSRQLRRHLRRMGWTVQETTTEVQLSPPGVTAASVEAVPGDEDELDESQASEAWFGLEHRKHSTCSS
jgi:hypothetical protein